MTTIRVGDFVRATKAIPVFGHDDIAIGTIGVVRVMSQLGGDSKTSLMVDWDEVTSSHAWEDEVELGINQPEELPQVEGDGLTDF
jgi:hypothetical protein